MQNKKKIRKELKKGKKGDERKRNEMSLKKVL